MPNPQPSLVHGRYFHIYNRGINGCNLFAEPKNYEYFLTLYDKYISEIAQTFAWVLMPNHFHLLVKIKDESGIRFNPKKRIIKEEKSIWVEKQSLVSTSDFDQNEDFIFEKYKPENQFSNLFNAYAQAFNRKYHRTGSLFEHPFHRKEVDNIGYFKQVILYIHQNPVHHGFCSHPVEYPWSSYITCISDKITKLQRDAVLGWFNTVEEFKSVHTENTDESEIEKWLGI
jgi:REP element-mobilizing transposase RayT